MCIYLNLFADLSSEPYVYQDLQAQLWVLSVLRTLGFKKAEMFSSISTHSQTWSLWDLHRVLFYISLNSYFVPPSTFSMGIYIFGSLSQRGVPEVKTPSSALPFDPRFLSITRPSIRQSTISTMQGCVLLPSWSITHSSKVLSET